ncbi:MAG: FtsW/RodA/SpoVE family cell cycle protein, partial [Acidobacteriota bacterium]
MNRERPYDRGLIMTVLALLGFGLIMVFSASTVVSAEVYGSQTSIFTRQLLFVVIGLVGLMVSMKVDYHFYEQGRVIYPLLLVSLALLIYLLVAPESGGVQRWIRIGPAN